MDCRLAIQFQIIYRNLNWISEAFGVCLCIFPQVTFVWLNFFKKIVEMGVYNVDTNKGQM